MPFDRLPTYTVTQLERMAEAYLSEQFGPAPPVPVDIDFLVEKGEGLLLDFYPGLKANHQIVGGVFRDTGTGELAIYIDESIADDDSRKGWTFYRMTVAEELAHVHLHREIIKDVETPDDFRALQNHPSWQTVERNAKRFAAAILMPAVVLGGEAEQAYKEIVGRPEVQGTFGDETGPSRWMEPVKKWLCDAMSRRFEVSFGSMKYRLREWPAQVDQRVERSIEAGSYILL